MYYINDKEPTKTKMMERATIYEMLLFIISSSLVKQRCAPIIYHPSTILLLFYGYNIRNIGTHIIVTRDIRGRNKAI